jgi:outer membrane translocation and assembly module TamA
LGFLPATDQLGGNRMLLTGDLNIRLINGFGKGENLMMQFQQIQFNSPRLQIAYQHPYIGGSVWGLDLSFDGFRKDSSFLNIRLQAGVQYSFRGNTEGKFFIQQFITTLDLIDTALISATKKLPVQLDQRTSYLGMEWKTGSVFETLNPRNGILIHFTGMAGIRRIRPNNVITSIKSGTDPAFNFSSLYDSIRLRDFTFRFRGRAEKYISLGKISVLKTALNIGFVQNRNLLRNELFQIGGLQLLRGFDDESIFASYYSVFSFEYRLLTGPSSYLYAFTDVGHLQNQVTSKKMKAYLGTGVGTAFETRAGMFNVAFAVGGGGGVNMNLRQSKIHLGYINRF